MSHLKFRGANDAFHTLVELFAYGGSYLGEKIPIVKTTSRNGNVLQITEPMIITYGKPLERVLFNQARDANPFFHLYESLWMLAGREDVAPLAFYNSKMADYSDDGARFNAPYGNRWRNWKVPYEVDPYTCASTNQLGGVQIPWKKVDQLALIIDHLKRKPDSRRCVLNMWSVYSDLLRNETSKDLACNTEVMFGIRQEETSTYPPTNQPGPFKRYLDMTVINRSNDTVWGMLGANVVHFSFLLEYMAAQIGVEVGVYNQISNNLHVYEWNFKPDEWLADTTPNWYEYDHTQTSGTAAGNRIPLIENPQVFDKELPLFVETYSHKNGAEMHRNWKEPFFQKVAAPMCWAFRLTKTKQYDAALSTMREVVADDWRIAGSNWILKRKKNWEAKQDAE